MRAKELKRYKFKCRETASSRAKAFLIAEALFIVNEPYCLVSSCDIAEFHEGLSKLIYFLLLA
jgi:hypothetical protein